MIAFHHVCTLIALGAAVCATVDAYLISVRGPVSLNKHINDDFIVRYRSSLRTSRKLYDAKIDAVELTSGGIAANRKRRMRKNEKKQDKAAYLSLDEIVLPRNVSSCDQNITEQVEALVGPVVASHTKQKNSKAKDAKQVHIEPSHWIVPLDDILFREIANISEEDGAKKVVPSVLRFTVRGNPLPLRRHRTSRGFVYNPSAATQKSFRTIVEHIIATQVMNHQSSPDVRWSALNVGLESHTAWPDMEKALIEGRIPLWDSLQPIAVSIVFRMKRPKSHFIANRPGVNRLKKLAPRHMCATSMRTDVDNLAKFVLDSLNGLVYADDRQIISLHVTKLYDNDDTDCLYQGSTCVCIRLLQDDNVPQLLLTSMNMF